MVCIPGIWKNLLHPEDRERILKADEYATQNRTRFFEEYRLIRRDGSVVWVKEDTNLIHDKNGAPLYRQGILLDITKEEEALEDWEEFLEGIEHDKDLHVFFITDLKRTLDEQVRSLLIQQNYRFHDFPLEPDSIDHWKEFLSRVGRERPRNTPSLQCKVIYPDEQDRYSCVTIDKIYPKVIMKRGLHLELVLDNQQVNSCGDVAAFADLFDREMKNRFPWYTP